MNGDILTSLADGIDLSLNQFLAKKSLNEARVARILDKAINIELDEDDPSQSGCATGLPAGHYNGSAGAFAEAKGCTNQFHGHYSLRQTLFSKQTAQYER